MRRNLVVASKFLSLVLRHQPELIGLALSSGGWVSVDALIDAAARHGNPLSRELLDEVVFSNDKQRFAFSDDGLSIRANQGHSVSVDLELQPKTPPAVLFHGTATRFLSIILEQGLRPMQRHHVHLSANLEVALRVGGRHGKPIVLTVAAEAMNRDGLLFYQAANGVWLTDEVAPRYLRQNP
jgi:putative RNA 2'-phosphotransferase